MFSLDADEVMSPYLTKFLEKLCVGGASGKRSNSREVGGYLVKRSLVFLNKKLRFGKTVDHPLRLFKKGSGEFIGAIHEKVELNPGIRTEKLKVGEILHHSYEDLADYFERFNRYTSKIAQNHQDLGHKVPWLLLHILRPWIEFITRYFLRFGFLDGYAGYCYALVSSFYTFVKYAKFIELQTNIKQSE